MIFVSSSCVKSFRIADSISSLHNAGFKNIELSGGTQYYEGFLDDLIHLKKTAGINYLCHNYFPPPRKHFVLNLASLNDGIYEKTVTHLLSAIQLCKKLNIPKLGFHSGFLTDIKSSEIGKKISISALYDRDKSKSRFIQGYKLLCKEAGDIDIYIENNVLSWYNYLNFGHQNPFFLVKSSDYIELKKEIDFKLLLDVAHLKVSCQTLELDLAEEMNFLCNESDYIHLSDNGGKEDTNSPVNMGGKIWKILSNFDLSDKTLTIEVYDELKAVRDIYTLLESRISNE
jgi:sugar phosphate isomerase/epimerase